MLKQAARIPKFFAALLIIFKVQIILINKIIFRSTASKILDPSAKSFFLCMSQKIIPMLFCIF